jgi:mRNA-degrading endonuclease RelE of RelBE toxin-antitoxin system
VIQGEFTLLSREQQRTMLRVLESSPGTQKRLTGPLRGFLRYRCGEIRVVFGIDEKSKMVTIVAIGMRRNSEVYDRAVKRT